MKRLLVFLSLVMVCSVHAAHSDAPSGDWFDRDLKSLYSEFQTEIGDRKDAKLTELNDKLNAKIDSISLHIENAENLDGDVLKVRSGYDLSELLELQEDLEAARKFRDDLQVEALAAPVLDLLTYDETFLPPPAEESLKEIITGAPAPRVKPLITPKPSPLVLQARAAMLKGPGPGGLKRGGKPKRSVGFGDTQVLYNQEPTYFLKEMKVMHAKRDEEWNPLGYKLKRKRRKVGLRWADYDEQAEKNSSIISSEGRTDLEANQVRYYEGILNKYKRFDWKTLNEEKSSAIDVLHRQLESIAVDEYLNDGHRLSLQQRFTEMLKVFLDEQIDFLNWSIGDTFDNDEQDLLGKQLDSLEILRASLGDGTEGGAAAAYDFKNVDRLIANGALPEVSKDGKLDLSGLGLDETDGLDKVPDADKVTDLHLEDNDLFTVPAEDFKAFKNLKNVYVNGNPDFDYNFLRQSLVRVGRQDQITVHNK